MVRMTVKEFTALQARRAAGKTAAARPTPQVLPSPAKAPGKRRPPVHPGPPSVPEPPALEPLLAGLAGVGRCWTLLMPYVEVLLTSNQRLHHFAEHRIRRQLRADGAKTAMTERLPRLERAAIFYVLHPRPINRKRDPGNWAPTVKAYVDGLVTDRGLLPDDNHAHLLGPNPVMGPPVTTGYARMSLVIVELLTPSDLE